MQYVATLFLRGGLLGVMAGVAWLLGALVYQPGRIDAGAVGGRKPQATTAERAIAADTVQRLLSKYSAVFGVKAVAPPPKVDVAAGPVDVIDSVTLAGVVERGGETLVVFVVTVGAAQTIVSAAVGGEVVADWKVETIQKSSAVLRKAGKTRTFELFK